MTKKDPLQELSEIFNLAQEDNKKYFAEILESTPYETKLAITAWVFEKLVEHARQRGSYRGLIYERLGFDSDAYAPLYEAGGMTISNEFDLKRMDDIIKHVVENKIESMKPLVRLCDTPGCFERVTSHWPSEKGPRLTCTDHYDRRWNDG